MVQHPEGPRPCQERVGPPACIVGMLEASVVKTWEGNTFSQVGGSGQASGSTLGLKLGPVLPCVLSFILQSVCPLINP